MLLCVAADESWSKLLHIALVFPATTPDGIAQLDLNPTVRIDVSASVSGLDTC